ncbi:MAG: 4Fe-4S dicluster domain-containing protein [Planctomycetota bacterium]|jgi:Pyruvate/2-oxoacid:ferredoxin oxidoreductase delta subunit
MSHALSRRDLLLGRFGFRAGRSAQRRRAQAALAHVDGVAWIQAPSCLAHQGTFCSVCVEQCPEEGAIVTNEGRPRVVADTCTGCRICHDVCPAPGNAIIVLPRVHKESA